VAQDSLKNERQFICAGTKLNHYLAISRRR